MITPKGFAFSCPSFSIKIKWNYVGEMNYGKQWQNRTQNAFIDFKLSQTVAPSFKEMGKEVNRINSAPRLEYRFSGFKNFIETYDTLRRSYTAHQSKEKKEISPIPEPTIQTNEHNVDEFGAKRRFLRFFLDFHDACNGTINQIFQLVKAAAGLVAGMHVLVASFVLIPVLLFAGHAFVTTSYTSDDLVETRSLLHSLMRVNEFYHRRHYPSLNEFRTTSRREKEAFERISSEMWVHRLQDSATELAQRFVFAQLQLSELRRRRANRLLVSDYSVQPTIESKVSLVKKLREGGHRGPSSLFSARFDYGSTAETTVKYQEQVNDDQVISQVVHLEEAKDRSTCLQLASELVELTELSEEVFSQFISMLLSDVLYSFSTGEEVPHQWSDTPPEMLGKRQQQSLKDMEPYTFDADLMLKVIRLRRHLESLFHLNPLESNEKRRRVESILFSRLREDFLQLENNLMRHSKMNETDKEILLSSFYKNIVLRNSSTVWSALRNNVDEIIFWHSHQGLWKDHVSRILHSSNSKEKEEGGRRIPSYLSFSSASSSFSSLEWKGLPVFRGLLCFTNAPQLFRRGIDITQSEAPVHSERCPYSSHFRNDEQREDFGVPMKARKEEGGCNCAKDSNTTHNDGILVDPAVGDSPIVYPFEFLRTEATVFQHLSEKVIERWINELDLFLEGIELDREKENTPLQRAGTPYFSDSVNFEVRSRLLQIARKNTRKKSLQSILKDSGMRSSDPALQSVYTTMIGLGWDNLKDVPYIMLNSLLLQQPTLSSLAAAYKHWLIVVIVFISISIAMFITIYKRQR